jgi:hypothetical protein
MPGTAATTIAGSRRVLLVGMWSAWLFFALSVAYAAAAVAAGAARGVPNDPFWAIAEIITIVGAVILVILMAVIHDCAPPRGKILSLTALGWTLVWAALTITVHFVQLTVARRIDVQAIPGFTRLFGFEWPSLLFAVELLAWHLFLGLSLVFAAFAFVGGGREAAVRIGLTASGLLCVAGLIGPAVGDLTWRFIGVFGYGVVFPIVCFMIGLLSKTPRLGARIRRHVLLRREAPLKQRRSHGLPGSHRACQGPTRST